MGDCPRSKWITLSPMNVVRTNVPAVVYQNKLYVFGGCHSIAQPLTEAEMYDPEIKEWVQLPPLPRPRNQPKVVVVKDKIFLIGGYTTKGKPVKEIDVFDINSCSWDTSYPDLKTEVTLYMTVLVCDEDLYVMGGSNHKGEAITDVYVLRYGSEEWKKLASLSTARYAGTAYEHNRKIYLIGGRCGKNSVNAVDIYDVNKNEWNLKMAGGIPKERVFSCSIKHENFVYLLNGLNPPITFHKTVEKFDLNKEEWSQSSPTTFARADTSLAVINDYILVAAGMCEYGPNQVTEIYNTKTDTWHKVDDSPTPRIQTTGVALDNAFVILGGMGLKGPVNNVEALSLG